MNAPTSTRIETAQPATDQRLLTLEEVAELLGTGLRFTRRFIAERRIRFVKVGRHVRIPSDALREFIEAATVPAAPNRR